MPFDFRRRLAYALRGVWWPLAAAGLKAAVRLRGARARRGGQARALPPRVVQSAADWCASPDGVAAGARCVTVAPAFRPGPRPARTIRRGGLASRGMQPAYAPDVYPPVVVAEVGAAHVLAMPADVVTASGALLWDLSYASPSLVHEHRFHRALSGQPPEPQVLPGRTAVISSLFGGDNYFHWMHNVLPRAAALHRAGMPLNAFDHVIVTASARRYADETLALLGVPPERRAPAAHGKHYLAENLTASTSMRLKGQASRWACDFVRELVLGAAPPPGPARRRLFVGRGDAAARRLLNEPEIDHWLAGQGFETVRPGTLSVAEQARLFAEAEVVVAAHGAALANLVFCAPGARVVELLPPEWGSTSYWELSACMNLDYAYLWGLPAPPPYPPGSRRVRDYSLPLSWLQELMGL